MIDTARLHAAPGKIASAFAELSAEQQDAILKGIEEGSVELEGLDGKKFFENLLTDVQQGFFADPIYGGNRDMCRLEDDRISRRPLRLSRLGCAPQRTAIRYPPVEHRRAGRTGRRRAEHADDTASLPHKDVAIVGLGWTGSILANELTDAGLDVVAIERGPWRDTATDIAPNYAQDELRYRIRHELFLRPEQTTFTFRNKMNQTALPIRTWGAFMPPNGVGGGGVHWNAETWRFLPSDFVLRTHLTQRYGAKFLPADMTIQDWGVTYEDLEPHYDRFEYLCGTSGTAGNLQRQDPRGRQSFRGPALAPVPQSCAGAAVRAHTVCRRRRAKLGYKPFPQPSGNMSRAYTNPLGVRLGPCTYCGFCEWFALCQLLQGEPADDHPAGPDPQAEFPGARQ